MRIFVFIFVTACSVQEIADVLPPEVGSIIKETNTDQHIGIKIGGKELDLLKVDEEANQLIEGFIGSLLEKQDMCMEKTAQYFHSSLLKGKCVKRDLAQYSLMVTKHKIRNSYSSANSYKIDSIYKVDNKDINEPGAFYSYYLNSEKTRRVQVFFPKNSAKKISDFHFVR
ncbi:hypothetical protein [Candidatus Uabimicrobium sp. HlEnr_7]|uniref:hypothetical protein n=1 Tax=Candidatus Uabimicrobium helgolandensis TaxID=3095367 RepID=UPI00355730FF